MTPEVKQSSPVHLRRHKLMKRMHYLLLQEQNPEQKQRFWVKKKKQKNWKLKKQRGRGFLFLLAVIPLVNPVAHSKQNISRDKRPWKWDW